MSDHPSIPNGNNYSGYFVEKSISELVLGFINKRKDKTALNIFFGITVLIGADIIKTISIDLVKEQKKQITNEILNITKHFNIFSPIKYSFQFIFNCFNKISYQFNMLFADKKNNFIFCDVTDELFYNLEITNLFLSNLMKYFTDNKNCCKFKKTEDQNLKLKKNKIYNNVIYSNITIPYENTVIKICNNIIFDSEIIKCENGMCIFEELMETYIDLLDDTQISTIILERISDETNLIMFKIQHHVVIYIKKISQTENNMKNFIEKMCYDKYKNIIEDNNNTTYIKKIIICANIISKYMMDYIDYSILNKIVKNEYELEFITIICKKYNLPYVFQQINTISGVNLSDHVNNYILNRKEIIIKRLIKESEKKHSNSTDTTIQLKIKTNSEKGLKINSTVVNQVIKKFINQINNQSFVFDNKNKIKMYIANVETKELKEIKPNPAHIIYFNKKKQLLKDNKDITNEQIIQLLGIEPEKELEEKKNEKEIKIDYLNERYTNFSNLYLSDSQDERLKNLLNSFQMDKERLEELGISNKLCLLLHGEPGTGKTTTIVTTASYFNRDIFYISLNNISNTELKMIFDYVNGQHTNQGIIVLEDFDTMTKIVEKRTDLNKTKTTINLFDESDDKLTLSFFLNILDGILTSNNSIVIMTTNHLDKIDPAIYREGRVDSLIEMKKSDYTQIKKMFKSFILRDIDPTVLERIIEYEYKPVTIIGRLRQYIKLTNLTDAEIMEPFIT